MCFTSDLILSQLDGLVPEGGGWGNETKKENKRENANKNGPVWLDIFARSLFSSEPIIVGKYFTACSEQVR